MQRMVWLPGSFMKRLIFWYSLYLLFCLDQSFHFRQDIEGFHLKILHRNLKIVKRKKEIHKLIPHSRPCSYRFLLLSSGCDRFSLNVFSLVRLLINCGDLGLPFFGWHRAIPMAFIGDEPQCDLYTAPTAKKIWLNVCCDFGVILLCSLSFYCLYVHSLCQPK